MQAGCAKTAERNDVLLGWKLQGTRETLYEMGVTMPTARGKRVRCGLCQITLGTCSVSQYQDYTWDTCRIVVDSGLGFSSNFSAVDRPIPADSLQLCVRLNPSLSPMVRNGRLPDGSALQHVSRRPPADRDVLSDSFPRWAANSGEGSFSEPRRDPLPNTKIFSADEALVRRLGRQGDLLILRGSSEVSVCCRRFLAASVSTRSSCAIIRCTRKYLAQWSGSLRNLRCMHKLQRFLFYISESDWGCFRGCATSSSLGRHSKCIIYPFIMVIFFYFSTAAWAPVPLAQWHNGQSRPIL